MKELRDKLKEVYGGIKFDPIPHTYTLNGHRLTSVTKTVARYTHEFDKNTNAARVAAKTGVSTHDVLNKWEAAGAVSLEVGNRVHQFAEHYPQIGIPSCERESAVLQWYADHQNLSFVATELVIGDERLGVAGTIDCLMYDKETDSLVINDWKTNKYIGPNEPVYDHLQPPFHDITETNLHKYFIQVNMYAVLLGVKGFSGVRGMITHLPPEGGYICYNAPNYTRRLHDELTRF